MLVFLMTKNSQNQMETEKWARKNMLMPVDGLAPEMPTIELDDAGWVFAYTGELLALDNLDNFSGRLTLSFHFLSVPNLRFFSFRSEKFGSRDFVYHFPRLLLLTD